MGSTVVTPRPREVSCDPSPLRSGKTKVLGVLSVDCLPSLDILNTGCEFIDGLILEEARVQLFEVSGNGLVVDEGRILDSSDTSEGELS